MATASTSTHPYTGLAPDEAAKAWPPFRCLPTQAGERLPSAAHPFIVRSAIMLYLGRISGSGTLKCEGEVIARAAYDFDGFFGKTMGVTSSGELRVSADDLQRVFGRTGVQLLTDDGRLLDLGFSEKALSTDSDVAHVDVTGGLPSTSEPWHS